VRATKIIRMPTSIILSTMINVKSSLVGRSGLLLLLLLSSCPPHGANAHLLGGGVLGFLRSLEDEERVGKKTLWFYCFFGANLHPSKLNLAKDCDYDDPDMIQFCPPAINPMVVHSGNPNLPMDSNPNLPVGSSLDFGVPFQDETTRKSIDLEAFC
jgi:hypothetical protein